jgi:hypothetical protein
MHASYIAKNARNGVVVTPENNMLADLFSNVYATFQSGNIRLNPARRREPEHIAARAHYLENP